MNVGVLALQGDVPEHRQAIRAAAPSAAVTLVQSPADLSGIDAVILPGGESTTMADLLARTGVWGPLSERLRNGLPTLATCAGLILLAKQIEPSPSGRDPPSFGMIDLHLRRNDYGRQAESFEAPVRVEGLRGKPFPGVFIRSPRVVSVGNSVTPIAWRDDEIVGVRSGAIFGLTFHPELSGDTRLLSLFLSSTLPTQRRPRK